ncbi:MAG: PAS domain S-box protein [Syntrophobacteraceae bacterium]
MNTVRSAHRRYIAAVLIVALATALRAAVGAFGVRIPFVTFYPAVMIASIYGGMQAGLLAIALSTFIAGLFFMEPVGRLWKNDPADWLLVVIFVTTCILICYIVELMYRALARVKEAEAQLKIAAERGQAMALLHQRDERYRVTLASIGDSVIATDASGAVAFINAVAVEMTGRRLEDALGRPVQDVFKIINEKTRKPAENIVERVLRDGGIVKLANQTALVTPDGREIPIEDSAAPIKDREGNITGVVLVFHDVTERRRTQDALRESEDRLRLAVESAELGTWDFNPITGAVTWSDRCKEIFGLPDDSQMDYETFLQCLHPDDRSRIHIAAQKALDPAGNGRYDYEYRCLRPDGVQGWVFAKGQAVFGNVDGKRRAVRMIGTVLDITGQKRLEEDLRKSRDELELRVRDRTAELAEANSVLSTEVNERRRVEAELKHIMSRLEESNRALRDFVSIASHDLQEPLRKVSSFGKMLKDKHGDSLGEQGMDYLKRILGANERMQSLLTALLEYSRLSTRANPFTEVELTKIVQEVLSDLEVRIENVGGEVQVGELPVIQADPSQMRQLFQNLIGNGLKFHKEGERPVVRVSCSAIDGRTFRIVVEDNGIGFDERYLDRIFAPFQRLHGRSSRFEGTGMGLAICKKIVERHGGSITAKGALGQGSAFIVTLPQWPIEED